MPVNNNWSEWEDQELRKLVEEHGPKKWSLIATKLKTKGSKQCRRRWKNYLNANLKTGGWTPEEDAILIDGHKKYGNRWTEISKLVGGRTDNAVKNRWAALCKRNARLAKGIVSRRGRRPKQDDVDLDSSDDDDEEEYPTSPRQTIRRRGAIHKDSDVDMQGTASAGAAAAYMPSATPIRAVPAGAALAAAEQVARAAVAAASHGKGLLGKRSSPRQYGNLQQPNKRQELQVTGTMCPVLDLSRSPKPGSMKNYPAYRLMRPQASSPRSGSGSRGVAGSTSTAYHHSNAQGQPSSSPGKRVFSMPNGGNANNSNNNAKDSSPSFNGYVNNTSSNYNGSYGVAGTISGGNTSEPGSPPARKGKPQLTLLIPNAAAEPPVARAPNTLEIHVLKDLLTPQEQQYAEELNGLGLPLHIVLGETLEPPLTTSRRAAQDAVDALMAGSPTQGFGPLSLFGGPMTFNAGLPSLGPLSNLPPPPHSTTSTNSEFAELLKWIQNSFSPGSVRTGQNLISGLFSTRPGNATTAAAQVEGKAAAGGSGGGGVVAAAAAQAAVAASPRPTTRAASRAATPRSGSMATPRSGTATAEKEGRPAGTPGAGVVHEGHKQLLSKLFSHAKASIEAVSQCQAQVDAIMQQQQQQGGVTPRRSSPRLTKPVTPKTEPGNAGLLGSPPPASGGGPRTPRLLSITMTSNTGASAAAIVPPASPRQQQQSLPSPKPDPGTAATPRSGSKRASAGTFKVPGGGATPVGVGGSSGQHGGLDSLGNFLFSPGGGLSAMASTPGADVMIAPALSAHDITELLDILHAEETATTEK